MAARFRIDQTGPGTGTLDRSRSDLVNGQAINLVVPSPVGGATYTWEIIYKYGSSATLSASTGTSVSIGPGGSVGLFCAFLIQLTETIGPVSTRRRRIAAVRGGAKGLRPLVFSETANPNSTRTTRNADDATDNELRTDLDGVSGDNSQSWTGWIEDLNRALKALEDGTILPFEVTTNEAHSTLGGGNIFEMVGTGTDPDAPGSNGGKIYAKLDAGETKLFYLGFNGSPVCISDVTGGSGTVVGNDPSTPGAILLWDSADGTLTRESPGLITEEASAWLLQGLHSFEFVDSSADLSPPAGGGRIYSKSDGGDYSQDLHYVKADSTIVPLTRGNTLARLFPFEVVDQAGEAVMENGYAYGFVESPAGVAAPVSGGRLYVRNDGAYLQQVLSFINGLGVTTRLSTPGSFAVPGTAMEGVLFTASDTVYEGKFARFDVTGGTCVATLDANIPIGGSCVVKLWGVAGANQVDIVDGGAQNIDGVATYSLTTDNAFARLTKMEDGSWAVG